MAFKTINFHGGIGMAALAKIAGLCGNAVAGFAGVAINTRFERMLTGSISTAQGIVALVFEQIHVVTPHKSGVSYTLSPLRWFDNRSRWLRPYHRTHQQSNTP
jgi:hypothetical protein